MAALVLGIVATGLAAWQLLAPGGASCQTTAWDTTPTATDLPAGWTISASQYDVSRKSMTFLGPAPADSTTNQAVIYATITCYPQGAADSVTRSADAATAAGQQVTTRNDLGDQGFSAVDDSGATFLQLRHADVVVYLAASGDATSDEVDIVASAFDLAMGGDGGNMPIGTIDAGSPGASASALPSDAFLPSDSPAAPELEAALPSAVGNVQLTADSVTGDSILGDDQGSRAIAAALRSAGKQPSDLRLAQASDAAGNADLYLTAFAVNGMDLAAVRQLVLEFVAGSLGRRGHDRHRDAVGPGGDPGELRGRGSDGLPPHAQRDRDHGHGGRPGPGRPGRRRPALTLARSGAGAAGYAPRC